MTNILISGLGFDFPTTIIAPGVSTALLDANGEYCGGVFRFPKTGTLTYISFATSTITTGETITARLETVDQSTGQNTGTLYTANANGSVAIASGDDSVVKHCQINGETGVSVTAGDEAAFVLTAPTTFNGNIVYGSNITSRYPYGFDYLGSTFTLRGQKPMVSLVIDGAYYTPMGCEAAAASSSSIWGNDHNPDRVGCIITCPIQMEVIGLTFPIDLDTNSTAYFYDTDGSTLLESQTFDSDVRAATTQGLFFFRFGTPRILKKGLTYYFCILPSSSTHVSISTFTTVLNGSLNPLSGGHNGNNTYKATCNGAPAGTGSWTTDNTTLFPINLIVDNMSYSSAGSTFYI